MSAAAPSLGSLERLDGPLLARLVELRAARARTSRGRRARCSRPRRAPPSPGGRGPGGARDRALRSSASPTIAPVASSVDRPGTSPPPSPALGTSAAASVASANAPPILRRMEPVMTALTVGPPQDGSTPPAAPAPASAAPAATRPTPGRTARRAHRVLPRRARHVAGPPPHRSESTQPGATVAFAAWG